MGRYRVLEGVAIADCAVEIEGTTLDDLFETAAAALCEIMADPATLARDRSRSVTLRAPDGEALLFDWLSELVFRKDRDQELYPRCTVRVRDGAGRWSLNASLEGASIRPDRGGLRADVKAVTLHQFQMRAVDHGYRARVVFDI
jgi:protein archease